MWISSPRGRNAYEISFLVLFILFVIALEFYDLEHINLAETLFMIYASGFCLEKLAAMQVSRFLFCLRNADVARNL